MTPITPVAFAGPVESSQHYSPTATPTSFTFQLQNDLPAGFVSVLVADAYGWGNQLLGVTDTRGNRYSVDSNVVEANGDGSVFMASAVLAMGLSTADAITIHSDLAGWTSFYFLVIGFTDDVGALDVAAVPEGTNYVQPSGGSLSIGLTPSAAGELIIGLAAYQTGPVTDDPSWTHITSRSDSDLDHVVVAYQVSADTSALGYSTSAPSPATPGFFYAASAACAYGAAAPPPPGQSTIGATSISTGVRERKPCVARTSTQQHE